MRKYSHMIFPQKNHESTVMCTSKVLILLDNIIKQLIINVCKSLSCKYKFIMNNVQIIIKYCWHDFDV